MDRDFTDSKNLTLPEREGREHSSDGYSFLSELLDQWGRPRLDMARNFFSELQQQDVPYLIEGFQHWRDFAEYLILKGENRVNGEKMFLAVKCSKRGNDVFSRRLDKRLGFLGRLESIRLFSIGDFEKKPYMPTNLLWVTLTYNPALKSLSEAWETYMKDWNLWITNLRNRYGKIEVLKFSEAFPNEKGAAFGYPHIHAVLLFKEAQFKAFPTWEKGKDGKEGWVFRVQEMPEIRTQGKWHSFIDVKAIHSGKALGGYLRKHTKNTHYGDSQEALVSQSLLWLYRKQTFSLSSGFRKAFLDLMKGLHNSKISAQKTLDGNVLDDWVWSCHGVRSCFEVGVAPEIWIKSLSEAEFFNLFDKKEKTA
jgi:hypothetical protein